MNVSKEVTCDYEEQAKCREYAEIAYQQGYKQAIKDMRDNLIRNSRTEIIDGEITLVVTEDRINVIATEMLRELSKTKSRLRRIKIL